MLKWIGCFFTFTLLQHIVQKPNKIRRIFVKIATKLLFIYCKFHTLNILVKYGIIFPKRKEGDTDAEFFAEKHEYYVCKCF